MVGIGVPWKPASLRPLVAPQCSVYGSQVDDVKGTTRGQARGARIIYKTTTRILQLYMSGILTTVAPGAMECDITGGYRDRAAYFAGLTTRRARIAMV